MTNPTSFTYSFSNPGTPPAKPEPELFALDKLSHHTLPDNQVLVRNPRTGKEMILPQDAVNALNFCTDFRTIEQHVDVLMEGLDGGPARAAAIRAVVQSVHDGGLTISAREIVEGLAPDASTSPIPDKPVVVIITCDRPPALERLLESILNSCDLASVDRLFVVDDSRSEDNGHKNRELTDSANRKSSTGIHYFGAAEASALVAGLIGQLPQHEKEIRFLLDRDLWKDHASYGVARNYSHLLSVGKPVVVFDDDTVCEVFEPPQKQAGVEFSGKPREAEFFADHDEWRELLDPDNRDPVSRHMQCLGLKVSAAIAQTGTGKLEQESLRFARPEFAAQLKPESTVLITECGSVGDPGTGSNRWLPFLPADSRERLLKTEGLLTRALHQRCTWLGRVRPVFFSRANISQVTGFDNRHFLPPYFPITRGEDRILGEVVRYIYPNSVTLEYPWAVPHLPIPEREWSEKDNLHSIGLHFPGDLTNQVIHQAQLRCLSNDIQARLEFLAICFRDLAGSTESDLINRLMDDRHGFRVSQLSGLQTKIAESSSQPEEWQHFLKDAYQQVESSTFSQPVTADLKGIPESLGGKELIRFWRDAWRDFGQSLLAWSEIREAARAITESASK
jgi:hypothetical protein